MARPQALELRTSPKTPDNSRALPMHGKANCRSCSNAELRCIGPINDTDAGNGKMGLTILYECPHCGLLMRHPCPDQKDLYRLYSGLNNDLWRSEGPRPDHVLAARAICESGTQGTVLDVGCFRGEFVASLPPAYEKFGVEPSRSARSIAQQQGVHIVGETIEEAMGCGIKFDVVTMIDVIEHLPRPFEALQGIKKLLVPGGLLIVSTGNTDALFWRLNRLDYWYYNSGHCCFFNLQWFRWASRRLGLCIIQAQVFSHYHVGWQARADQYVRGWLHVLLRRLGALPRVAAAESGVCPFWRIPQWNRAPSASATRDHLFVVMKLGEPARG